MKINARRTAGRLGMVAATLAFVVTPFVVGSGSGGAATPTTVVSGFDAGRTSGNWGIFESCLATTHGYLTDAANFGPSGVVKDTITLPGTGVATATAASLKGVNIFFTGYVSTTSYTTAEKTALLDYVKGGGALIGTTDATSFDMSSIFGLTLANSPGGLETGTITDATSPLADGPFGKVTTFDEYDSVAHYTNIGPGTTVGTNPEGPAIVVIPPGALSAGSGPVVMVSDVDVFSDCGSDSPPQGSVTNEVLIKNIFAYLAVATQPTPTTTSTSTTVAPTTTTAPAPVTVQPSFTG